jgi:drug/metabolite transporter (DMT)-like permease
VLSVGVGFTLQVIAQRHAHAADAAIILSSETVFAALFGAWFMGDRLSATGLLGCALILGCILAVQLLPRRGQGLATP